MVRSALPPLALGLLFVIRPDLSHAGFVDATPAPLQDTSISFGAAWADYDGDGDLDLFVTNDGGANRLFRQDPTGWVDVAPASMTDVGGRGQGASWADYDRDGDLDLYVTNLDDNLLLRNDGAGAFADRSTGFLGDAGQGQATTWSDLDLDGDADLYFPNADGSNKLLTNEGSGVFLNAPSGPWNDSGVGTASAWGDYDNDGDQDLYLVNLGSANRLLRNDAGTFTNVTSSPLDDAGSGTSAAWGDFDNDEDLDLYVGNTSGESNRLYRNDGGSFVDVVQIAVQGAHDTQDVSWVDIDNDADLDLYVMNVGGSFYLQNTGGNFASAEIGDAADGTLVRAAAWADYDEDGDLDVYVARGFFVPNALFRNDTAASGNHWLHVDLEGVASEIRGIGARIRISAGGVTQIREVTAGGGYLSHHSLTAEFGLGAFTVVDEVVVQWPSGSQSTLLNVDADQRITITEGATSAPLVTVPLDWEVFPNPFRQETSIRLSASRISSVAIDVVDVRGRLVETLIPTNVGSGRGFATWRAGSAAPGVYFVRVLTETGSSTQRVVLLR